MKSRWLIAGLCIILFVTGVTIQTSVKAANEQKYPAAGLGLVFEDGISMGEISDSYEVESTVNTVTVTTHSVDALLTAAADDSVQEEEKFDNLVIAQVDGYTPIRSNATDDSEVLGKLYNNQVGELLMEKNGWYKIQSGSVTGYVKGTDVVTGNMALLLVPEVGTVYATVNTETLFVRGDRSLSADIIGMCPIEEELIVEATYAGWVQVSVESGKGYVSTDYVILHTEFEEAESIEEEQDRLAQEEARRQAAREAALRTIELTQAADQTAADATNADSSTEKDESAIEAPTYDSDLGSSLVTYAMQFLGNPYVYGGTSLTNGTDCSGFTQSLYKVYGVDIPRTSTAQRSVGEAVDGLENAKPGDIICYSGHVAIYIGDGQIIHASTSKTGIIIGTADYRTILSIRRIF